MPKCPHWSNGISSMPVKKSDIKSCGAQALCQAYEKYIWCWRVNTCHSKLYTKQQLMPRLIEYRTDNIKLAMCHTVWQLTTWEDIPPHKLTPNSLQTLSTNSLELPYFVSVPMADNIRTRIPPAQPTNNTLYLLWILNTTAMNSYLQCISHE